LAFWQASDTSQALASGVISRALPGRGLSSSAAITPSRTEGRWWSLSTRPSTAAREHVFEVEAGGETRACRQIRTSASPIPVGLVSRNCNVRRQIATDPEIADSGATGSSIPRRSAFEELTDAPLRTSRRPVGADRGPVAGQGRFGRGHRLFVEAVLYRYRAGIPWRDLPERLGGWKNTHRRFSRWAKSGVWKRVFLHLASPPPRFGSIDDRP
jgi:transposase